MLNPPNKPTLPDPEPLSSPEKPKRKLPLPEDKRLRVALLVLIAAAVVGLGAGVVAQLTAPEPPPRVPLTQILADAKAGKATKAEITDEAREVVLTLKAKDGEGKPRKERATFPFGYSEELTKTLVAADVEVRAEPVDVPSPITPFILTLLPVILIIGFFIIYLGRKLGMAGFSGKRGEVAGIPDTRFADVAGCEEAKNDLQEVAEFLQHPEKFETTGAKVPRGYLLVGPPGTGKTLLARAVAGEAGVPFFALSGSDFVEVYAGIGASRMRTLFEKARKMERAIIFIDEIDAMGRARSSGPADGASGEREQTLNQLLVEMDGFTPGQLFVLAATNRADILDPALLRPGRFDRRIQVPAPDRAGREALLEIHTKSLPIVRNGADAVDLHALAKRTPGLTGADIAALANEAALAAARLGSKVITQHHFEDALGTTVLGRERRSAVITDRDRQITAWHEAGHAIAALCIEEAADPMQVSIVPRGPAGGVTWMQGSDNVFQTRRESLAQLSVMMGGRAAEEILLEGDFTQGAQGDLQNATKLAMSMVNEWAMIEGSWARRTPDLVGDQAASEEVLAAVDQLISDARERAVKVLATHRNLLEATVEALLEREDLDHSDLMALRNSLEPRRATPRKRAGKGGAGARLTSEQASAK